MTKIITSEGPLLVTYIPYMHVDPRKRSCSLVVVVGNGKNNTKAK